MIAALFLAINHVLEELCVLLIVPPEEIWHPLDLVLRVVLGLEHAHAIETRLPDVPQYSFGDNWRVAPRPKTSHETDIIVRVVV